MTSKFGRNTGRSAVRLSCVVLASILVGGIISGTSAASNEPAPKPLSPSALPKASEHPSVDLAELRRLVAADPVPQLQPEVAQLEQVLRSGTLRASSPEVAAAVGALLGAYAQEYQAVTAETAAFHDLFVQTLAELPTSGQHRTSP